jgi:hypothetical protein
LEPCLQALLSAEQSCKNEKKLLNISPFQVFPDNMLSENSGFGCQVSALPLAQFHKFSGRLQSI